MTHNSIVPEERAKLGLLDNFLRLSIGIEDIDDLIQDLKNALEHVSI
jgi:cystathionine gamma-lyase